jgi:two-component system response regulator YesN
VKILIADDEKLVRYSIRSMLEELHVPARSISAVCDGLELVEVVGRLAPDIALVDIRMPRLDGLAAIERARALSPQTRWIILTSHSSFEYAKKAIQLGVADYLLKPVSPRDLAEVLGRVERELREELLRLNDEFEARINSLLHNTLSLDNEPVEFISGARLTGALLFFDSALEEAPLMEHHLAACREIRARIGGAAEKLIRIALCTLPEGEIALIGGWRPEGDEVLARDALRGFLRRVHQVLDSLGGEQVQVTQLHCDECPSFPVLLERLARARELAPMRAVLGVGQQIALEKAEQEWRRGHRNELCADLQALSDAFRGRGRLDFLARLERVERGFAAVPAADKADTERSVARFLRSALGLRAEHPVGSAPWHELLSRLGEGLRGGPQTPGAGDLAAQVTAFVDANYMRDIGIGQIAARLSVTPNYLSTLFHREKGVTFLKYVTRLRMERARGLLEASGTQVQEAARAVGYFSVRHFSRLFQKQYGLYPSDVQRQEKKAPEL